MSESSDFFNDLKKILVWIYSLLNYILAGIFTRTILNSEKLQLFPRVFSFFSRIALSLSRFFFFFMRGNFGYAGKKKRMSGRKLSCY